MINVSWQQHVLRDYSICKQKNVIIRLDLNLPVTNGIIEDTSRLDAIIGFLTQMSFAGARMILISHFGEKGESLQIVARELTKRLSFVHFSPSTDLSDIQTTLQTIPYGEALLLENIRCWQGETENLPSFARALADLGDIYINDAFSVSHRDHASVTGIPRYILSYLGPTCERELVHLSKALNPPLPTLLVIGGAKISTKLPLINRYLDQGVHVFVGGAMVHAILKARGIHIGNSLYDKDVAIPGDIIYHPNIITPVDVVLDTGETVPVNEVPDGRTIVDCGKETLTLLDVEIERAHTVIMNGPLGLYEQGWLHGTEHVLSQMGTRPRSITYIGGGDTVTAAHKIGALSKIGFVSLGGGAMLDYLASGTLPGIDAVTKSH